MEVLKAQFKVKGLARPRQRQDPLKSILKPSRPVPPPTLWTYVRRALAAAGCRRRCWKQGTSRIGFQPSVRVLSYPRKLCGGDGVPTDGSPIALGLGGTATESQVAICTEPRGVASDQISWMPAGMREEVLEESMGFANFAAARAAMQPEMMQVLNLRKDTTEDGKDVTMMPQSMQEARARARQLSDEVASQRAAAQRAAALRRLASPPSPRSKKPAPGPRLWHRRWPKVTAARCRQTSQVIQRVRKVKLGAMRKQKPRQD